MMTQERFKEDYARARAIRTEIISLEAKKHSMDIRLAQLWREYEIVRDSVFGVLQHPTDRSSDLEQQL